MNSEKRATNITEQEVKLCALCGALNHQTNRECFLCGWRGAFERDARRVGLAWQRLFLRYEDVRAEHVTGSGLAVVEELGKVRKPGALRRLWTRLTGGGRRFLPTREAAPSRRTPAPPFQ